MLVNARARALAGENAEPYLDLAEPAKWPAAVAEGVPDATGPSGHRILSRRIACTIAARPGDREKACRQIAAIVRRSLAIKTMRARMTSQWVGLRRLTTFFKRGRCFALNATRYFDTVPLNRLSIV